MVRGNMYLHMYGPHLHKRTMMMRMFWVTMVVYVPFVAINLNPKRCPCLIGVSHNIVRIALIHTHVTMDVWKGCACGLWGEPSLNVACSARAVQEFPQGPQRSPYATPLGGILRTARAPCTKCAQDGTQAA